MPSQPSGQEGIGRIAPPRPQVLQVRVSEEEQRMVAERAKAAGYDSVSAYMRAAALGRPQQPA